MAKSADGQI